MLDPDDRDESKNPRSLLSLGAPARRNSAARSGSLLSIAAEEFPEEHHDTRTVTTHIPEKPAAPQREEKSSNDKQTPQPRRSIGDSFRNFWGRKGAENRNDTDRGVTGEPRIKKTDSEVRAVRSKLPEFDPPKPLLPDRVSPETPERQDGDYWRPLIDPMMVITGIGRSKTIIVLTTILGALVGLAIALSTPKMYEAVAELLVDPRNLAIVERDLTAGGGLPSDATLAIVENQVRVVTSGNVLNKVVDRLDLASDPEFNGQSGAFGIGALVSELRSLFSQGSGPSGDVRRRALAVGNLAESLEVERGGKTFVISITAKTRDPEKSALIANTLTQVFLETYGQIQAETAGRATTELTSRLDELRKGVEEAERAVEKFKAENDIVDAQGRLITDDEIVKLNDQLSIARARTIELNARAASARSLDVNAVLEGSLPESIASPVVTELRSQYASIKQEADRVTARLGPRHPQRVAVEAQLGGIRDQLQAELRRVVSSLQVDLRRARQLEQDLASRLAQLKARQAELSEELVTLRELERDATSKRSVYEAFLLRSRETGEQQSLNTANVSIISQAYPPLLPVGPSRMVITMAGALFGFVAGIAIGGARGAWASLRGRKAAVPSQPVAVRPYSPPPGSAPLRTASTTTEPTSYLAAVHEAPHRSEQFPDRYGTKPIDNIREELREFREAVRDLAESRARRRDY